MPGTTDSRVFERPLLWFVDRLVKDPQFRAALGSIRNLVVTAHHVEAHVCRDLAGCTVRARLDAEASAVFQEEVQR